MLSVIINVKNAARTIQSCLESIFPLVQDLNGEIIVVDMHSTDDTLKIVKQFTSQIFQFEDVGYADPAREFAFSKAHEEWLMIIDADEIATPQLCEKIASIVKQKEVEIPPGDCYYIPRHNKIFDYYLNHTLWYPDYQLRLFRQKSIEWIPEVHSQPQINGQVVYFPDNQSLAFQHDNYQTISEYWQRTDRYTSFQAKKIVKNHQQSDQNTASQADDLDFSSQAFFSRFWQEFKLRFFAGQAYLDGNHGTLLSLLQASAEASTWGKVWQAARFPHQVTSASETLQLLKTWRQDLAYHRADIAYQNYKNPLVKFFWQIRRKLKI